jgi:hypothetical protein
MLEAVTMALERAPYFYTVELSALEEHLSHSMAGVARMREKAIRRKDFKAADQIKRIQRVIDVVRRHVIRLK